jgi:5-dehydro-4-deoxyglucarate dehydratase
VTARLPGGLLTFPVTPFVEGNLAFDEEGYRAHISWLLEHGPTALFAAGGTGEFFSLRYDEYRRVVEAAVRETGGRIPVIGGCGYGTATACDFAQAAEAVGADGILILPPYLVAAEQSGLEQHVAAVCRSTRLAVIVYNRDNCILGPDALARLCQAHPNLVGFKDGVGDIELMARIRARLGDRLFYVGGLPTAETFALPYQQLGVTTYSSAIFNFLPRFAMDFFGWVKDGDAARIATALEGFVLPYVTIRNRGKGFAVSIVKAGMRCVGRPAGPVRPPLTDLSTRDVANLSDLIRTLKTDG